MHQNKNQGNIAENIALEYLKSNGLKLIQRNFFSRFGEIDLIMRDNEYIIFVEVKYRGSNTDNALSNITPTKQKKLIKTAQYFLLKSNYNGACRFDAIVIDKLNTIEWFKNIIIL